MAKRRKSKYTQDPFVFSYRITEKGIKERIEKAVVMDGAENKCMWSAELVLKRLKELGI